MNLSRYIFMVLHRAIQSIGVIEIKNVQRAQREHVYNFKSRATRLVNVTGTSQEDVATKSCHIFHLSFLD